MLLLLPNLEPLDDIADELIVVVLVGVVVGGCSALLEGRGGFEFLVEVGGGRVGNDVGLGVVWVDGEDSAQ